MQINGDVDVVVVVVVVVVVCGVWRGCVVGMGKDTNFAASAVAAPASPVLFFFFCDFHLLVCVPPVPPSRRSDCTNKDRAMITNRKLPDECALL